VFLVQIVVQLAQQAIVFERKLVTRRQLLVAHATAKTVDVVDAIAGPHYQVAFVETVLAFETLFAK
jgi:hypothetical protein